MSCEKLYLTAPEMLECTARVVSCTPNKNDGYDLETDRTPFFPEGGGQLSDIGTVYDPMQGFVPVTHCFEANGTVLHRTGKPFSVGEIVTLKVDVHIKSFGCEMENALMRCRPLLHSDRQYSGDSSP